jgi:uncharacterized protein YdiU (UPF0061 family)
MKLTQLRLDSDYLSLDPLFYDKVRPAPLRNPYLIGMNPAASELIGLDGETLDEALLVRWLNGEYFPEGSEPFAMCYAGHQFGHFVPRLGDGRAVNLGSANGWNLQLKGAGTTLYSRMGDGRAVLRSSIREYLMSEAMHALGIPTTRALAIIGSQERVVRERLERGAIVMRMSPSWVRFGTFEYFCYSGEHDKLEQLADYVIKESYPHLLGREDAYFLLFDEVVACTAKLMAQWQAVGFNHGVMNTDNMSIAGLTIDYGPYAFLDDYHFDYVCNHTDVHGRYSYGNQPPVAYWNLSMLMRALSPIVNVERMQKSLERYGDLFNSAYLGLMGKKLGFETQEEDDDALLRWLLRLMQQQEIDYTLFFRVLSRYNGDKTALLALSSLETPLSEWLDAYDRRLAKETLAAGERHQKMLRTNPKYVLKNYILQEAIEKAEAHDLSGVDALLRLAQSPFDEHPELERYALPTPAKEKNLKLSCSS